MSGGAPDYVDPVVGWRTWLVDDAGDEARLASVVRPAEWPVGRPTAAACPWVGFSHRPPGPGCRCGLYAARNVAEAAYYAELPSRSEVPLAIGLVALWGSVVECAEGWRASAAYPSMLYVPVRRAAERARCERIAWDLTAYGVPLQVLDCTERGIAQALWATTPAARGPMPVPLAA